MRVCLIGTQVLFFYFHFFPQVIEHNCNRKSCDGQVRPVFFSMSCGVQNCSPVLYSMGLCQITFLPSYFSSYLNNLPMYIVYCSLVQVAQKDKLSELQLRVRQLLDQVDQITKEQNYQRVSCFYRWYHTIHLYVK